MASPCIITFGGKKYTYDKWIELLHDGQLDRLIADGSVSINPFSGPKVKAEGKPGEAKGEQAPTETGRLSAPDQVLQRNPDGTFSIQSKADIQNFFERVIGLPTPLAALNATLFELRANAWSQATGMPTDAYYQMYLLRDYVKAEKQELGQRGMALFQIVGENAQLAQDIRDNLQVARDMETAGKDAKTIRLATGWERGADKKWRYEIPDVELRGIVNLYDELTKERNDIIYNKAKGKTIAELKKENSPIVKKLVELENKFNELNSNKEIPLGEIVSGEVLKAYPKLKDIKVIFGVDMGDGTRGSWVKNENTIYISGSLNTLGYNSDSYSTLTHEIQHAIQDIEGFASGGNLFSAPQLIKPESELYEDIDMDRLIPIMFKYDLPGDDLMSPSEFLKGHLKKVVNLNGDVQDINFLKREIQKLLKIESDNKTNIDPYQYYLKLAGEVEARNVQKRIGMTLEQRRATTLQETETEDVARDEQIVLFGEGVAKQELGQDGNIPPDTYFEQKEKALKEALENAKSRLEAKKRALAKRIAKEGQMSMFAEQNPLMADFDASNDVIEQILRPFNGEIMRINAEIRDNELARRSAAIGREQQLKLFQPLKQNEGYRGSWSMTPDRKARIIAATLKANATTFIHEYLGHDYLNDIAQAANGGSLIHKNMLTAAVLEFVKYKKGLYKFDQVMAAISQFDPLNKSALPADLLPIAIEFHEFFAEAAQEFMRDADGYEASRPGNEGQAWVALLRSFRDYLVDLASSLYMNGYRLSEPMRQVFRNAFGEMSDIVFDEADAAQDRAMEVVVQVIEKNIEKDGIDEQPLFQVEAFHGSPYKFEKFSTEKIGTGEGAQAFGWGLYFTDLESIARGYAKPSIDNEFVLNGVNLRGKIPYNLLVDLNTLIQFRDKPELFYGELKNFEKRTIESLRKYAVESNNEELYNAFKYIDSFNDLKFNRNLYKATLHKGKTPDQYTWLEWDRKPNKEQAQKLLSKLNQEQIDKGFYYGVKPDATNADIYKGLSKALGGPKQASLFLLENGIDGIKYPAESIARGATSETARGFNYVVFDENAVTIEEVELFQDINKELEDKIAGQIMTWAFSMYQQKTADKFNIIAELRKKLEGKRTDPRWGERQIQVYNAIIDSRAEQIKSLYEPSQGKKFRQTAQTLLEEGTETRPAEYAFDEDVKRILRGEMGEYTPVSLNKMVQDAAAYIEDKKNDLDVVYKVLESFSDVNKFLNWVPIASLYLRELQARNRILRTQNTPQANQQIQENLVKISKIFDRLLNEATERGRKLNELKAMSLLDPRTLVWIQKKNFKESFKEQNQKLQEDVRALLKSLQEYKEQATEYIQNLVKKTETIESLQNEITSLSERIASLEELRKKNFVGNAFGKELDFLKDEKEVKKVFNDFFGQITKSDDLELFSSAGLTPLQGLFYAAMTPTKKGGANQFKDLGFIYQLLSERLAKKGKAIQLSTAADYYRQMRDLLISEGASPTHFLDNDQVDQRVEELKESSEANIESLRQKLEAKKAALAAKKIKKEKKKDLQAEIEATIKRYANIKNVRNAMIALGEDMKNLAFEEDADIDAVEQQVLDMISNRARSSNVDDAIVDQIRQKVKTLFDNYRKAVWDGVSQSIAKTINERARKALNVTQPAVDTTFSEFVRLLGEKANELYRKQFAEEAANRGVKPKTKTPEESLAFAVRALNDENGMKLWSEARSSTRAAILADDRISPYDKQVALTMLDNFLHNIYDSVLPETDRLKLVRKAMDEAGLLSSTNTVAWTTIWEKSRGDKAKARELVKDKIRQYLPAQSSDNVTDKLIDILMDKYDAYIEERRVKLVESQLKAMQKGFEKLTQGTKASKVKRRSFAQKFIRLVNSGFFSDPQSVTPEKARELFAQYLGLTRTPSAQEWAQVEGLAQEIQDAPEGHERDLATEKLSAWFEYYKPGYGAKVKQSVFIANLLGAPTTVIKNTTGWMEVITKAVTAFGKDIVKYRKDLPFSNPLAMPDFNYFKVMLKGFKQGDFLDILRNGGVNQGDNLSVTTDPAGFSRVRILEYYQPKNMYQRAKKSLRYVGRIMSAFDAASQRSVSEIAYYQLLKQLTEKSDPSLSPSEVAKRAYDAMYSINIEEATLLAKQTFDEMGIIRPDKARLRRMAYQNIRNARKDPSKIEEYEALQEVTNNAALEEAYKSKMLDNVGAATLTGFAIEKAMQGIYEMARKLSVFMYPGNKYKQQEAQAKYEARFNQVRLQVLPFMTGVFNFMEKTLEKVPVYAALKGASQLSYVGYRGRKMKASPDEYSEFDKINQMYLANRAYEHLIRAGLIYAVQAVVSALIMGSADDDDEESTRVIGSETFAKKGFGAKKNIYPENSIVFSNGVALPLGFMGSYGMSLGLQANMRDELKAKNKKWRQEKPTISDYISVLPDVFMRSLGTFLEMGMLEGTNRALRAVTNYDADTWLTGAIINWSVNSNLPWIGLSRQAADTYRELAGQATTPMTFTEKAMRSLGVPSLIVEGKPALDWRGRPLRPMIKNSSGIAGIVGAVKPLQMDEVDKFLDKNDVLLQWKRSSDPDVTTEDDIVRYSFPQEIRYYYRASVSTGWDVAIQRMYYKRNARVLTEREEKNGYTKDDVVAKDMAQMHNAIERYSGNFIKVLSLTQTAREAKDNMEDAKKDIENILMKYQSEADINSGEAEVKAQGQAKNIVNVVKGVILDKPGDYESATAPWYAKPFLNSGD